MKFVRTLVTLLSFTLVTLTLSAQTPAPAAKSATIKVIDHESTSW